MRVVVDSNALRSHALRDHLRASAANKAVLVDYALIEAYKKNPLLTIRKSMEVLGERPKQVLVLRSTGSIARMDPRRPDLVRRMVWDRYTRSFPLFAESLPYIGEGEPDMTRGALWLGTKAREHLARLDLDMLRGFQRSAADALPAGLTERIRDRRTTGEDRAAVLVRAAAVAAASLGDDAAFADYRLHELLDHFAFRHMLAMLLHALSWSERGRPALGDARMLNDAVDTAFAAHATYHHGLLTSDLAQRALHEDLRALLATLAARPGRIILPRIGGVSRTPASTAS